MDRVTSDVITGLSVTQGEGGVGDGHIASYDHPNGISYVLSPYLPDGFPLDITRKG